MRKILTHICCVLALSVCIGKSVRAQEKILIKGKVIDENKQGIIGASVIEQDADKRTVTGVATDIDGNFALPVKSVNNKISFSYIGYKTQVKAIGAQRTFVVQLVSNNVISEVQITSQKTTNNGTGLNIDVRDQTTANATIQAKDLEELQATSIDQALQGRLPGVDIVASSGDPGAGMAIRIRGTASINGATNPLIVVDGMPYETAIPTDFNFATADEQGYASLLSIAPSDIKDITVLKDAAATAVWGPRASNGVLIINTKRGAIGPPTVSYTFKGALFAQPSAIPMLNGNQYSELIPEEYQNGTGSPLNSYLYPEFQHDPSNPYYYYNYGQNTDWLKAITRTGYSFDNNLSITGGGEKARYFASVGYTNQTGTTLGTGLNRLNARLNLDYVVSTRIHFKTDIAYTHSVTLGNYSDGTKAPNIRAVAQNKMPTMSIYEYNEYGQQTPNYFTPPSNVQGQYVSNDPSSTYNPVALSKLGINNSYGDRVTPHFSLTYTIAPELLTATSDIQFDINTNRQRTFLPASATGQASSLGTANRAYEFDTDAFDVFTKTNLIYTPHIGDNQDFQGLLSIQTDDNKSVNQSLNTANTASDILQDPSAQSIYTSSITQLGVGSGLTETRTVAALLSAQYKLLDRYILHVDLRGDGNSRFGTGHRYGLFPSASARYRFSGEPFMKKFTFINDLSFRGSYGVSGNAPSKDYLFYSNYLGYNYSYLGQTGVTPSNIELDNLRFEKVTGKNLGMNLIMFNYRLNFDLEVYQNRTTDLFFNTSLPAYSGYSGVYLNVGTMDNQGFEISLNTMPFKSKDWIINFDFNIAHNENVIRAMSPYVNAKTGTGLKNGEYVQTLQVGNPLGSFYGYIYQGVYPTAASTVATDKDGNPIRDANGAKYMLFNYPSVTYQFQAGDAKYADINHDGVIDQRDIVYLGNGNPAFTGGFGPTITFKRNWKLNAFFSYRTGFQIINQTELNTTNMIGYNNQSTAVLRRWEKPGDITDIPRALYRTGYNSLGSSRYVSDGSYLRWTSLTLRYNIDQLLAKKLGIKSASVYVTGQNFITWTHYLGQDPEISPRAGDIYQLPVDQSTTPASKTYTLGLTASF